MDDFIDFCNLNPDRTATGGGELEAWLTSHGIPFKHREGPAGDTVFLIHRTDYDRVAQLWGEYRGSSDYILKHLSPWVDKSRQPPPRPS